MRRVVPLSLLAGAGYVGYKASTDGEFRSNLQDRVPAAQPIIDYLPEPVSEEKPGRRLTEAELHRIKWETPRNLDQPTTSYKAPSSTPIDSTPTPATPPSPPLATMPESASTPPHSDTESDVNVYDQHSKTPSPPFETPIVSTPPAAPTIPLSAPTTSNSQPELESTVLTYSQVPETKPTEPAVGSPAGEPETSVMSGKAKLARLLGKNGYDPEKMPPKDIVDESSYGKPKSWTNQASSKPASKAELKPAECPVKHGSRKSSSETSSLAPPPPPPPPPPPAPKPVPAESDLANKPVTSAAVDNGTNNLSTDVSVTSPPSQAGKSEGKELDLGTVQIEALKSELASQTKWEAVRLQEAVRAQILEDKKEHAKELAVIAEDHATELDKVRERAREDMEQALSEQKAAMQKEFDAVCSTQVADMMKEKEADVRQEIKLEFSKRSIAEANKREGNLQVAQAKVDVLSNRFDKVVSHGLEMKDAAKKISNAYLYTQAIAQGGKLVGLENDGLAQLVTAGDSMSDEPVQSIEELRHGLHSVAKHGLAAAVVPYAKIGSVWAHALAAAFSRLKVSVDFRADGRSEPRSDEERIRLAQWAVDEGDLHTAVKALEGTSGLARDVISDWLKQAKHRLTAMQAADVLMADAIIAQVSLMKGA